MSPSYWSQACVALSKLDPTLATLITHHANSILTTRYAPFETLLRSIVGQQISLRAAEAIWSRLSQIIKPLSDETLLALDPSALRQTGLSNRKVEYMRDLAQHFASRRIVPEQFAQLDDETIIQQLTAVHGIGRWSAEMFLIFNLLRPDIWPVDDIGLQRAIAQHYPQQGRLKAAQLRVFGEAFRPWRTVASWYLWRSLDGKEVHY